LAGRNLGHITAADYVRDRFKSPFLALLIALTGIVATMPYIALQIDKNAADLTDGSVSGLHEIWEAVQARADGNRGRTASACVEALQGQRGRPG
jgi:hypothetical protein